MLYAVYCIIYKNEITVHYTGRSAFRCKYSRTTLTNAPRHIVFNVCVYGTFTCLRLQIINNNTKSYFCCFYGNILNK